MQLVKVSIIVPVYNVAPFLKEALDSLVNQTLKDIEIICVDDCSTDESPKILADYAKKDSRIKIITQPKNMGEVVAKYTGAKAACADYIGTLDPDDKADTNMYQTLYDAMIQNNAKVAVCNFAEITENGEHIKDVNICSNLQNFDTINGNNIHLINPATTNKIIKKDLYIKALDFTQRNLWKDWYQFWRCFTPNDERAVFTDEVLYFYRQRSNSITHTKLSDEKIYHDFYNTVELITKYLLDNNRYDEYSQRLNERVFNECRWIYYFWPAEKVKKDFDELTKKYNIKKFVLPQELTFSQKIFSAKNKKIDGKKYKVITILGTKFKILKSND